MGKTAILVDGGFYRYRAYSLWGDKSPEDRANELIDYCYKHLKHSRNELYRIFFYDCPPVGTNVYHPFLKKQIDYSKTDLYKWMTSFLECLKKKRKVALRMGILSEKQLKFNIKPEVTKSLCNEKISFSDLKEQDFELQIEQKGVDMKIGIDISSMAYKRQVDQMILISADSDFVPAAKLARREGVDFILDPMWAPIKPNLNEHIDGLWSCTSNPNK